MKWVKLSKDGLYETWVYNNEQWTQQGVKFPYKVEDFQFQEFLLSLEHQGVTVDRHTAVNGEDLLKWLRGYEEYLLKTNLSEAEENVIRAFAADIRLKIHSGELDLTEGW